MRGRIHVSEATAECLRVSGKGHWLTAREDKIVAKGKGEMQTYFVQISPGTAYSSMSSDVSSFHEGMDASTMDASKADAVSKQADTNFQLAA